MNAENVKYLKDQLLYHGFGDKLNNQLEQKISGGSPEVQLRFQESVNGKSFDGVLNLRKADNSDMYFFNSYTARLDKGIRENIEHLFYINKGKGVTAKEAYNLLDGRAVFKELANKEGVAYHAWIQLDPKVVDKNGNHILKQYHENYGFDLGKSLAALPVKELAIDEEKGKLIRSLERGNLQAVTFELNGKGERRFIEANPQFKTLTVYDGDMKRMKKGEEKLLANAPAAESKDMQKDIKDTKSVRQSADTNRVKKTKTENSLLPKKRAGTKKGLAQ